MKLHLFTHVFLTASIAFGLSGCASTGGAPFSDPVDVANNLVSAFTVPPKFRQAVQRADWAMAAKLHQAHPELLDRKAPHEVSVAAAALNAQWQPRLQEVRRALSAALVPEGFSSAALASVLSLARDSLQEFEGLNLLAGRMSEDAVALKQELANAGSQLAGRFPDIFVAYNHGSQPLLIHALPVPLDRATQEAAVLRGMEHLSRAVWDTSLEKAAELVRAYAPLLPVARRSDLRTAYLSKASMARFGVAPERLKPSQKLALATEGVAYGNLRVLRLDAGHTLAPVVLDGERVESAMPLAEVESNLRQPTAAGDSLVVLIDSSMSAVVTELRDGPTVTLRHQVGTQARPNEAYKTALEEVRRLEVDLRDIEQKNSELQRQAQALGQQSGGRGSNAMAAVLGSAFGTSSVVSTRNELAAARATLAATSRISEQPVYREVPVKQLVRETYTTVQPIVYLADPVSAQVYRAAGQPITAVQHETVTLAAASNSPGPAKAADAIHLRLADFQADLDKASPMPLSSLDAAFKGERVAHEQWASQRQQEADKRSMAALKEAQAQSDVSVAAEPRSAAQPARQAANTCYNDLSYLDARLPQFRVQLLQDLREKAIHMNVLDVIRSAKAQGVSADDAVGQLLKSAKSMDAQVPTAGQCAAEVDALGTSDEAFIDGIRKGGLATVSSCEGIRNGCLCAGLAARLGAYVTRATAAAMQCHARVGNW